MIPLLLFLLTTNNKVVEAHFTETPPKIDGVIEDVWQTADSASNFVQFFPYEKEAPTEKTVVYILQDKDNLYFAFRCYAENHKPIACLMGNEEDVRIGIDPFGSKNTAYYFTVYASGIYRDGWILDDGRTRDESWDGVWYRAVKVYDDHWDVEVKIPFKSIRYKKGLHEWGVNFVRYIAHNRETDYWVELTQLEEDMVSKFGTLKDVQPHAAGYYFELYPEGFIRYDKYKFGDDEDTTEIKPRASLNFKWDVTPQTTINATLYPDFAQIESDPYTLNLSRYPTFLFERRPFFLEGAEIFHMSDFGEDRRDLFSALRIFYSRKIGKSLNGAAVPIISGLKLTHKSQTWNLGFLGAYTDEYTQNNSLIESSRTFAVLRSKHKIFENSDIGILFGGTYAGENNYNYALGTDLAYRQGPNQLILQTALSQKNDKLGWALSSGYCGFVGKFFTLTALEVIHDSFDVSNLGYVPWAGQKKFFTYTGPLITPAKGAIRSLYYGPGIFILQEPGSDNWSTLGSFILNPTFRNNWGFTLWFKAGPYYEADTSYIHRSTNLSLWKVWSVYSLNLGGNYGYSYNYSRSFLANQASAWLSFSYTVMNQVALNISGSTWIEWDPDNSIVAITSSATPRIDMRFNADMNLTLFNEFVLQTPETNFGETERLSNRIGVLFSWNFLPKSWLYIALNDYRKREDTGTQLEPQYRIAAVKAKYLIYF